MPKCDFNKLAKQLYLKSFLALSSSIQLRNGLCFVNTSKDVKELSSLIFLIRLIFSKYFI